MTVHYGDIMRPAAIGAVITLVVGNNSARQDGFLYGNALDVSLSTSADHRPARLEITAAAEAAAI